MTHSPTSALLDLSYRHISHAWAKKCTHDIDGGFHTIMRQLQQATGGPQS